MLTRDLSLYGQYSSEFGASVGIQVRMFSPGFRGRLTITRVRGRLRLGDGMNSRLRVPTRLRDLA